MHSEQQVKHMLPQLTAFCLENMYDNKAYKDSLKKNKKKKTELNDLVINGFNLIIF